MIKPTNKNIFINYFNIIIEPSKKNEINSVYIAYII